jgi:FkbH-like protein
VFLDDSKFERDYVRTSLPEVQVPELPEDPTGYLHALTHWNLFESSKFSTEDAERTGLYKSDADRQVLRDKYPDLPSYLKSLEMVAIIAPFNEFSLPRVSQLIQRSNQFNLTTRRHSDAQLERFAMVPDRHLTFTIRLKDRLGDNGIVAIVIGTVDQEDLLIDSWIMSCRVLGRRMEELTFSVIVQKAEALGCRRIIAQYIETSKNAMVSGLLPSLGFDSMRVEAKTRTYMYDTAKFKSYGDLPIDIVEGGERAE